MPLELGLVEIDNNYSITRTVVKWHCADQCKASLQAGSVVSEAAYANIPTLTGSRSSGHAQFGKFMCVVIVLIKLAFLHRSTSVGDSRYILQ